MSLLDVLRLAGGFNDSTYLKTIYLNEGQIIRSQSDNNYPEVSAIQIGMSVDDLIPIIRD